MTDDQIKDYFTPRINRKPRTAPKQVKEKRPSIYYALLYGFYFGMFVLVSAILAFVFVPQPETSQAEPIEVSSTTPTTDDMVVHTKHHSSTCMGRTKKGKPCRNKAEKGSSFCWRH
jgi:hypothetical protein